MMEKYKNIHIGRQIKEVAEIKQISISRICSYLNCRPTEINQMFKEKSLDTSVLLKWSKLLDYNFFMLYHTHLQLYKPIASTARIKATSKPKNEMSYEFKKNLYSPEIIDWLLAKLHNNELSINDIILKYHIPRTTIYRWKKKFSQKEDILEKSGQKKKVNFKKLYLDFISESVQIESAIKNEILQKLMEGSIDCNSVRDLKEINGLLGVNSITENKRRQRLNAYDRLFIEFVLNYQKNMNLSDNQISKEFKLSRNTIAKWNKLFGVF